MHGVMVRDFQHFTNAQSALGHIVVEPASLPITRNPVVAISFGVLNQEKNASIMKFGTLMAIKVWVCSRREICVQVAITKRKTLKEGRYFIKKAYEHGSVFYADGDEHVNKFKKYMLNPEEHRNYRLND